MNVLITGGSGFIGTNLVQRLIEQGHNVLNLDIASPRNPLHHEHWLRVDIRHRDMLENAVKAFKPEVVFHLAARTDLDGQKLDDYSTNTKGVLQVIEVLNSTRSVQRVVFASSRLVCRIGYQPRHELDFCPDTLYGESKVVGENLVRAHASSYLWTIVRPTSIWGPWFGVPYRNFFVAVGKGMYLHPGHQSIQKSFGYVGNTVHQLQRLVSSPPSSVNRQLFYLADYPPIDVLKLANLIQSAVGAPRVKHLPVTVLKTLARAGDLLKRFGWQHPPLTSFRLRNLQTHMVHDLSPLQQISPQLPFTLRDGVADTVAWMRAEGLL